MKILVYGPKARYDAYLPDFAAQCDAELVSHCAYRPGDGGCNCVFVL
jgi:MFS-type transporter involved in bile tolerance (Atg22 family)